MTSKSTTSFRQERYGRISTISRGDDDDDAEPMSSSSSSSSSANDNAEYSQGNCESVLLAADTNGHNDDEEEEDDDEPSRPGAFRVVPTLRSRTSTSTTVTPNRQSTNVFHGSVDNLEFDIGDQDDNLHTNHHQQAGGYNPTTNPAISMIAEPIEATLVDETTEEELREQIRKELQLQQEQDRRKQNKAVLKFDDVSLCGRDEECQLLQRSIERMVQPPKDEVENTHNQVNGENTTDNSEASNRSHRQCVIVSGPAGVGKTTLVETTMQAEADRHEGIFVSGKFDLRIRGVEPLSGIISVVDELCRHILALPPVTFEECKSKIINVLGVSIGRFVRFVPQIESVVGIGHRQYDEQFDSTELSSRLNDVFLGFFRVAAEIFSPIICFLDDIQWADDASLSLMKAMIADNQNKNLMVVASYRSEDEEWNSQIQSMLAEIDNGSRLQMAHVSVSSFSIDDLATYLSNLLQEYDRSEEIRNLADLCLRRTGGNIFHLRAFIMDLERQKLLSFDETTNQWSWDIDTIEECTEATDNVTELLRGKIAASFTGQKAKLLTMAACLGATFDEHTLTSLWSVVCDSNESSAPFNVGDSIKDACHEGFIEPRGAESSYRFVHDCIREAFLALQSATALQELRENMGWALVSDNRNDCLDVFLIISLLDKASAPSNDPLRLAMARLYLRATERCQMMAIYSKTHSYAGRGLEFLMKSDLESVKNRQLFLDLHMSAAKGALFNGDYSFVPTYCDPVVNSTCVSLPKKIQFYTLIIELHGRQKNLEEAVNITIDLLGRLGYRVPKSYLSRLMIYGSHLLQVPRLRKRIRNVSEDELTSANVTEEMRATFLLLAKLASYAYFSGKHQLVSLASFLGTQLTLEKGYTTESATLLVSSAPFWMNDLGDWETAMRSAELGSFICSQVDESQAYSTALLSASLILSYRVPANEILPNLYLSYEKGVEYGDSEMASYCIANYLCCRFNSGARLADIAEVCQNVLPIMESWKTQEPTSWVRAVFAATQVLSGQLSFEEFQNMIQSNGEQQSIVQKIYPLVLMNSLCLYLGEFELGAQVACVNGTLIQKVFKNLPIGMMDDFVQSMCLHVVASKSSGTAARWRLQTIARKRKKAVEKSATRGNPNVFHQVRLLKAEAMITSRRNYSRYDIIQLYTEARLVAHEIGFLHDEALAYERLAEFLYRSGDNVGARRSWEAAIRTYREWGALRKVDLLETRIAEIFGEAE